MEKRSLDISSNTGIYNANIDFFLQTKRFDEKVWQKTFLK